MKTVQLLAAILSLTLLATDGQAGRRGRYSGNCSGGSCSSGNCQSIAAPMPVSSCSGNSCSTGVVAHVGVVCTPSGCTTAAPVADCPNGNCAASTPQTANPIAAPAPAGVITPSAALAEVNARRAERGLRPYVYDPALTEGARQAATYRARYRIRGHVTGGMGDFQFLPAGAQSQTAGCGALEPSWGFQTCAMYDRYTYAGAASVPGDDGLIYHHLFVR